MNNFLKAHCDSHVFPHEFIKGICEFAQFSDPKHEAGFHGTRCFFEQEAQNTSWPTHLILGLYPDDETAF